MTQPRLRVAVVGLGYFSQFHLAAWRAQPDAELVGLCDRDPDLTDRMARDLGVPGDADLSALLNHTAPDIVDIIAPPDAHDALVRSALAPGRVIICQKPFCQSLDQARGLIDAARAADCRIVIHENFRFQPWYREIRDLLDRGDLGQVFQARFALRPGDGRGPRAYLDRQPAFQTMPRLLIHETGVHFIDLFRWLFGDITSVYADLRRLNPAIAGEDAGTLLLTHSSGTASQFDGNRLADHVAQNPRHTMGEFELLGEAGTLTLNGDGALALRPFGKAEATPIAISRPIDTTSFGGGCVAALIAHVVQATLTDQPYENEAATYLHVMQASAAAYTSAAEGRRIDLDPERTP